MNEKEVIFLVAGFFILFFVIIGIIDFLSTSLEIIFVGQQGIESAQSGDTKGMNDAIVTILIIGIMFAVGSLAFVGFKKGR